MKISSFHVREAGMKQVPVVVSIPHCGIYVPESIRERFASGQVRNLPTTDWYLHHLCDFLPAMGITTLYGTYSRLVADIDTPGDASLVPRQLPDGSPVYSEPLTAQDIQARRDLVYAPYHARLNELLQSRITRFGSVVLLDLHSFPSLEAAAHSFPAQVYVGDDAGRANPGWLTGAVQHAFSHVGLDVARNSALRSRYIVPHYGSQPRVSALYTSLRWDLYLDEQHPDRTPAHAGFRAFRNVLSDVFSSIVAEINAGSLRMNRERRLGLRLTV